MLFAIALLCAPLVTSAAQDTTAIKGLATRTKADADSVSSASKLSGAQQQKNTRAKARIKARQDSIITYVHAPIVDTTTPPPADTTTYIDILPGASIQAAVDAHPINTKFKLKAGLFLRQDVRPKTGNWFRGETGAIMDGQNTAVYAFRGYNGSAWVNNVHLVNIEIKNYAPAAQIGAIYGGDDKTNGSSGWILDSLYVHHNKNLGIRIGNRMQVLRTRSEYNTTMGIGGVGQTVLVDGLTSIYNNNGCPNNPGFESGGSKFAATDSLEVRNSTFNYNCGVGLWLDINNKRYSLHNNTVRQNYREGIAVEVSTGGFNGARNKIYSNTVAGNGWPIDPYRGNGWLWDAGIGIHASDSVEVYINDVDENYQGIVIVQQLRQNPPETYAPPGGYHAHDVFVHDNIVHQRTYDANGNAAGGAAQDVGSNAVFSSNNVWTNNTYYLGSNPKPFAWLNQWSSCAQWKAYGQDTAGTCNP
jgi:hypothetical protein